MTLKWLHRRSWYGVFRKRVPGVGSGSRKSSAADGSQSDWRHDQTVSSGRTQSSSTRDINSRVVQLLQLSNSWQDFDWHTASRGPSAIAEFFFALYRVVDKKTDTTENWRPPVQNETRADFLMIIHSRADELGTVAECGWWQFGRHYTLSNDRRRRRDAAVARQVIAAWRRRRHWSNISRAPNCLISTRRKPSGRRLRDGVVVIVRIGMGRVAVPYRTREWVCSSLTARQHISRQLLSSIKLERIKLYHKCPWQLYLLVIIHAKARDYVFTGVGLSVCLFVCLFVTTITK